MTISLSLRSEEIAGFQITSEKRVVAPKDERTRP